MLDWLPSYSQYESFFSCETLGSSKVGANLFTGVFDNNFSERFDSCFFVTNGPRCLHTHARLPWFMAERLEAILN